LLALRSFVFNVLFYLNLVVHLAVAMPTLLLPRWGIIEFAKWWGRTNLWLLHVVCGIDVEWRGLENIPPGPLIVASKHQSAWETFALLSLFSDPTFILKRELMWIPFFGWCTWRGGMIPIDRGAGKSVIPALLEHARKAFEERRQIIIFPEGTRRPPGAEPRYKYGVAHLYGEGMAPCLPIALNSGLFWPRRRFLRRPGTVRVEFLDPIPPGLDRDTFFNTLQRELESATARLVAEGERDLQRDAGGHPGAV
jgi:1-acyl-sn-glycerol-3-phosphate acyltransferase